MTPHDSIVNESIVPAQDDSYGYKAINRPFESNTGRGSLLGSNRATTSDEKINVVTNSVKGL